MTFFGMLKRPSAFLPLMLSAAALATVLVHVALFGAVRETDEGTAAHIFQILMAIEVPIVIFFAMKWLPLVPRKAAPVLALQFFAAVAAMAPVFLLGL